MWGALSTYRTATAAKRLSELSYAFERARFAVAAEESLNRKYRLQPSTEVLDKHREAATSLLAALQKARVLGDPADDVMISDVLAIHKEYLLSIDRMFAAVDAGRIDHANELDRVDVDPKFDDMEARVFAAADAHHAAAVQRLNDLAYVQTSVIAVTICAFAIGMGLVIFFEIVFRAQRERADRATTHECLVVRRGEDRFRAFAQEQHEQFYDAVNNMPLDSAWLTASRGWSPPTKDIGKYIACHMI